MSFSVRVLPCTVRLPKIQLLMALVPVFSRSVSRTGVVVTLLMRDFSFSKMSHHMGFVKSSALLKPLGLLWRFWSLGSSIREIQCVMMHSWIIMWVGTCCLRNCASLSSVQLVGSVTSSLHSSASLNGLVVVAYRRTDYWEIDIGTWYEADVSL